MAAAGGRFRYNAILESRLFVVYRRVMSASIAQLKEIKHRLITVSVAAYVICVCASVVAAMTGIQELLFPVLVTLGIGTAVPVTLVGFIAAPIWDCVDRAIAWVK